MRKLTKFQLACAVIMALFGVSFAGAFNLSHYATTSKLATGKWVKISIPENGMYEITYDELREMGFSNPERVNVYGSGGAKISEVMNGAAIDDLKGIPILRTNNKICFYCNGPISFSISDYSTTPRFARTFNPYSQVGCYFLTETTQGDLVPAKKAKVAVTNYVDMPMSLNYFYHEREMSSVTSSGKEMLGEDFSNSKLLVDYYLPDLADSSIVVQSVIAANATKISYATGILHSGGATDTTSYSLSTSRIYSPSSVYVFYNFASPCGPVKLTAPEEHGQYEPFLRFSAQESDATVNMARLDYFILTYKRRNILREEDDNQLMMGYAATRGNERFMLPNATPTTVIWNINNTNNPAEMQTTYYDDESGQGLSFFATSATTTKYIAFDPAKTLKKIIGYEPVENQNLHGMATPNMLIITDKSFHEQAQRVADLHTAVDGISVAVVDQDKVFNEFSSGTRDAMAYRLLCKMLYDRDNTKFKNLLLFGTGTYDNRELMGAHPGTLLTYESDNSNYEDYSYTSDDFFGFMDDNSGSNISAEKLRIGVGRITSGDLEEAKNDVDKLVDYYANPDYGVWRNNTMVMSDSPDLGVYMFQGEGYKNLIDNELETGMHVTTVHNSQYARSNSEPTTEVSRKTATEGKQMISNMLKNGLYFATYVGHAGPISFTKGNNMWVTGDVVRTNYSHWPIMSTACCDVAHFDGDNRGIAELMFHKRDGGAIAMLTSSRMVYAGDNDKLNTYFIKAFFNRDSITGALPTLGEAYMYSKLGFTSSNTNKLSFFLLGDPAIQINYPISRFHLVEINGSEMDDPSETAMVRPLMKFDVVAHVLDAEGNLDTNFNGDATMTLYDKEDVFTTVSSSVNGASVSRKIYFNRDKLTELTGRVVNGVFNGSVIVPKSPKASNEMVLLRVYAHKDNSDYMVNGFSKRVKMLPYDQYMALQDSQDPVITNMYINDEPSFSYGATVGTNSMLYITATDDYGINVQTNSIENSMKLVLDYGKPSYQDVTSYVTSFDEGKTVRIEFPLSNLAEGLHTLTYTVYDMVGNSAERTITFMVGQSGSVELTADAHPAYLDRGVNFDMNTDLTSSPEVIVRVTDATGKLVWMTTTSSFPVAWDMKDMQGNKVSAGLYRYFGTYNDGINYGGTSINKLIVLDPLKTAN
ncbi:MAG: type IX secretion system sortase PorU [Muribaculaceae bacterium]|nr:type IX secretion system sortase PorU [Muribaculaceae bacterium]